MQSTLIQDLSSEIKTSKKYRSIADEIVLSEINNYLKKNKITKISKQDIKEIRNQLHKSYASFQTKHKNKINLYLEELKKFSNDSEITKKLLSITLSTKERLDDYQKIYSKIFKITGKPKTIIDLGCGFNPFSYPLMNLKHLTYYAHDISQADINYLNEYFRIMKPMGLEGKASILDIRNINNVSNLPSADIVLILKVIDILDKNNHKPSEELIKIIINKTKFIVASFATKTLTRKNMNNPNRLWFELMLKRIGFKYHIINTENEIFYVINKI